MRNGPQDPSKIKPKIRRRQVRPEKRSRIRYQEKLATEPVIDKADQAEDPEEDPDDDTRWNGPEDPS